MAGSRYQVWLSPRTLAARGLALIVGGVFVWAGLSKVGDLDAFAAVVASYDVLPASMARPWAAVLPWVEVVAGAALAVGVKERGAALVILGMLGAFMAALALNVARGTDMNCGCLGLGGGGHPLGRALGLDAVLSAAAAGILRDRLRNRTEEGIRD